jgi:hypothetical protein
MVPEPEENPHEEAHDFTPFSKIRRVDLDPDSVVGKELIENFEQLDESLPARTRVGSRSSN